MAQGINLREELIRFYKAYYSANQMTLAIVAPQPIDELKTMAQQAFSGIPNNNVPKPETSWAGIRPFGAENSIIPSFGNVVEIVPVQDLRQVIVSWPIQYDSDDEREQEQLYKTTMYVAHLLGHEGPRSLLSYLKRKGWANSVAAAVEEELSDFELFEVVVGLTSQGLASLNQVIEAIYSYVGMIRDRQVPAYIVNEVLQLEELQWRFSTKGSPRNYATTLVTAMQKYPPEYYVAGPRRLALDGYNEGRIIDSTPRTSFGSKEQLERTVGKIAKFTDNLTVDNGLVTVLSKSFESSTDRKEKWYGTNYRVKPVPSNVLDQWKSPVAPRKLQIDFPSPNVFIPSESGLFVRNPPIPAMKAIERTFESRLTPIRPPRLIRDDGPGGRWKVYYKEDNRFGLPKAYVIMHVLTKDVFSSAKKAALANMYELCVTDRLGEYAYDGKTFVKCVEYMISFFLFSYILCSFYKLAGLAGLSYEVKVMPRGVRLTFGGYNDKLNDFAQYVAKQLSKDVKKLLPQSSQEFERYKDQIMRSLGAFDVKQPYFHASYYATLCLQQQKFQYTNKEMRDETRSILLPDLVDYAESVWKSGKGEALIQGNVNEQDAANMVKTLGDALPFKGIPDENIPPQQESLPLPPSDGDVVPTRLLVAEPNPADENSVSYVMLQSLDMSEKAHMLIELLSSIVAEKFYDDLRTKQQLGYIVSSGLRGLANTRTLSFIVQSNVAPSAKLSVSIFKFLDSVEKDILQKLSEADVSVYVKSLIDRKTEPDKDLATEVTRNWSEISSGRLEFDRLQKEARAVLEIGKPELIEFWRKLYVQNGRRMLITEVIPRQGDASSPLPPTTSGYESGDNMLSGLVLGVDDVEQFRRDTEKLIGPTQALANAQQV